MGKIKVIVIGHGRLGTWHAEKCFAHPASELLAIVDHGPQALQRATMAYPSLPTCHPSSAEFEDLMGQAHAVLVATPTSQHLPYIQQALARGKHVFCEKPVAQDEGQLLEIQRALRPGVVFQAGHSERCHKVWEEVDLSQEGLEFIELTRVSPPKERAWDTSVIQDLMIHDVDLLLGPLKFCPVAIEAFGNKDTSVTAILQDSSGRKAVIHASRADPFARRELRAIGPKGTWAIDLLHGQYWPPQCLRAKSYEKRDHLLFEQTAFYRSIEQGAPVLCGLEEALVAQRHLDDIERLVS